MTEVKRENPDQHQETQDTGEVFAALMRDVIKKFGSVEFAAAAVDKDCDIAAEVVVRWFQTGVAPQTSSISKRIVESLKYLSVTNPTQVGHGTKKLIPPMAPKPKPEGLPKKESGEEPAKE